VPATPRRSEPAPSIRRSPPHIANNEISLPYHIMGQYPWRPLYLVHIARRKLGADSSCPWMIPRPISRTTMRSWRP
jgi:hypothetical protein